jgi:drug/metabolite transporter (DMT)-like permease
VARRIVADTTRQGLLLAFIGFSAWGLLSPLSKLLLVWFGPLWLNVFRTAASSLVLMLVFGPERTREAIRLLGRPVIMLLTLMGGGITFFLFQMALVLQGALVTTLGFYSAPIWTALLARFMLGERLGRAFVPTIGGLGIGAWLALFGLDGIASANALGMTLAVASGATWAVYSVLLRRHAPTVRLRPLVLASFMAACIFFILLAVPFGTWPDWSAPPSAWGWMALLVAVPSLASVLLFTAALQRAPSGQVNVLVGMELAATVFFAWLILGESVDAPRLAGIGLVLASVTAYLLVQGRATVPRLTTAV